MALKIFLSYASEDRERALFYYEKFKDEGTSPWLDVNELVPGQNWELEIEKAFRAANVIVLLLSKKSVSKRGFVQREANDAISALRYKRPTDVYVIPLLLEDCEVPDNISDRLHHVHLGTPNSWEKVRSALRIAAEQQSIALTDGVPAGPFRVYTERLKESWLAQPGHEIDICFPRFESASKPQIADELTAIFSGRAHRIQLESRQKPWLQSPEFYPVLSGFGMSSERQETFNIAYADDHFLSSVVVVSHYGAGAAHHNYSFSVHNFDYRERLLRIEFSDLFLDLGAATKIVSEHCLHAISEKLVSRDGDAPDAHSAAWALRGAGPDPRNFATFTFNSQGLTCLFAPYVVAAFAYGTWAIDVPFTALDSLLRSDGPALIGGRS